MTDFPEMEQRSIRMDRVFEKAADYLLMQFPLIQQDELMRLQLSNRMVNLQKLAYNQALHQTLLEPYADILKETL